jgi:hypothetical protein
LFNEEFYNCYIIIIVIGSTALHRPWTSSEAYNVYTLRNICENDLLAEDQMDGTYSTKGEDRKCTGPTH